MIWASLSANYSLTNTTAAQKYFNNTANGAITLTTGVYRVYWYVLLSSMSVTSGNAMLDVLGAGTAVTDRWGLQVEGRDVSPGLIAQTLSDSGTVTSQTTASAVAATTGTGMHAHVYGMFRVTTEGTLIPSISLVTAAAAVANAGSYIVFQRVGDDTQTYNGDWS